MLRAGRTQKTRREEPGGFSVLATSYSRTTYRRTTIGAAAFHCRVRNGNGWGHCAMITRGPSRTGGSSLSRRASRRQTLMTRAIPSRSGKVNRPYLNLFQRTLNSQPSTSSLISTYRVWNKHFKASFCLRSFDLICLQPRIASGQRNRKANDQAKRVISIT